MSDLERLHHKAAAAVSAALQLKWALRDVTVDKKYAVIHYLHMRKELIQALDETAAAENNQSGL